MDRAVQTFRNAAHTVHAGKSPKQAKAEFNKWVIDLYQANDEPIPLPSSLTVSQYDGSIVEADTRVDVSAQLSEGLLSTSVTGMETVSGDVLRSVTPGAETTNAKSGQTSNTSGIKAKKTPVKFNIFSREWWTPARGASFAVAAGIGLLLSAGGVYLFNKYVRKRKDAGRRRRLHARSWNICNTNSISTGVHMP
jgi:hypothetical protein